MAHPLEKGGSGCLWPIPLRKRVLEVFSVIDSREAAGSGSFSVSQPLEKGGSRSFSVAGSPEKGQIARTHPLGGNGLIPGSS